MTHHIEYIAVRGVCKSSDLKSPIPISSHILSMGFQAFDKEYSLELIHRTNSCVSVHAGKCATYTGRIADTHLDLPSTIASTALIDLFSMKCIS